MQASGSPRSPFLALDIVSRFATLEQQSCQNRRVQMGDATASVLRRLGETCGGTPPSPINVTVVRDDLIRKAWPMLSVMTRKKRGGDFIAASLNHSGVRTETGERLTAKTVKAWVTRGQRTLRLAS